MNDRRIESHGLTVRQQKKAGRPHGWAKVHSIYPDRRGALNIEWDSNANILLCRVVTRGGAGPNLIIGDFVDYLLHRYSKRIVAINIMRR